MMITMFINIMNNICIKKLEKQLLLAKMFKKILIPIKLKLYNPKFKDINKKMVIFIVIKRKLLKKMDKSILHKLINIKTKIDKFIIDKPIKKM